MNRSRHGNRLLQLTLPSGCCHGSFIRPAGIRMEGRTQVKGEVRFLKKPPP
ncbi:hypothetical protein Sulac_1027 [Sulfobacillus acidophilus DSM 10332]|uniref:Uncharacterized protein n=1 Tax=Sulfobacillus acidophilus (strain ATCC 700253 / DSM 10332 / NAL) TaxID=679936 RepID=G8TTE7_SULAD|nr:hypothetical protein Sulac_1027 [Sulfobacillus acidophilus DSM 10332]